LLNHATRFCLIGPGRLGSTLAVALEAVGFAVTAVVGRADPTAAPAERPPRLPLAEAVKRADVLWLTVPDDQIGAVATRAAAALSADRAAAPGAEPIALTAIHSSGLGSLALLVPLARLGVHTLSLHPLQTFAAGEPTADALAGVPIAVTAAAADEPFGFALAEALGGKPFALLDENKPLYHLAATVASNLFVALESEAGALMGAATGGGCDEGVGLLTRLVETTAANLRADGPSRALTGPVARGDAGTVRAHLALLDARAPRLAAAYRALSLQALTLAAPRLADENVRALLSLLEVAAPTHAGAVTKRDDAAPKPNGEAPR
jgi:predicted short-subunit dehydrogenase-like oxidoreductase (DUF2520 family)